MTLSQDELQRLAKLARIYLTPEEQEQACRQLGMVFDLFHHLSEIPTDGVLPLEHPLDGACPLREDQAYPQDLRATWTQIAPSFEQGMFLVPKVIES